MQFELPVNRFETNNAFSTLNPAYTSDLDASISQPLLRGAGLAVNSHGIRIATYQYQSTQAQTKLEVIRVLADVDRIYWRLYAARQELDVRKKEYDLAVAQLERARRQAKAGVVAEVDVVRAESGVADTRREHHQRRNQLRDRQRELKQIINRARPRACQPTPSSCPSSDPNALHYELDTARSSSARPSTSAWRCSRPRSRSPRQTDNVDFASNQTAAAGRPGLPVQHQRPGHHLVQLIRDARAARASRATLSG